MINSIKRTPVVRITATTTPVPYTKADIETLIPHRDPFLLIDSITDVDLVEKSIVGYYYVHPENPVFRGHFPGKPVYPGVLQIETMGQLGLALAQFVNYNTTDVSTVKAQVTGLFTKIIQAGFHHRILPGDRLTVSAKMVECDTLLGVIAAQIYCNEKLCSYAMLEVYFE